MRAVVVLLLLIANAIVVSRNSSPSEPALPARTEPSLGLLATVDGGSLQRGSSDCAADLRQAGRLYAQAGERPACRPGEHARAPIFQL